MNYKGKLYGAIDGLYFDTGVTTDEVDTLIEFAKTAICRFCNNTGAVQNEDESFEPCELCEKKKEVMRYFI